MPSEMDGAPLDTSSPAKIPAWKLNCGVLANVSYFESEVRDFPLSLFSSFKFPADDGRLKNISLESMFELYGQQVG